MIFYRVINDGIEESKTITLGDLDKRGFPTKSVTSQYQWYSWLRFKSFALKHGTMEEVIANKELFLNILHETNRHYEKKPKSTEEECLEKFKGPQSYEDRKNSNVLHYYARGWYKWYRNAEFENQMEIMFKSETPIIKLELLGHAPWAKKVSPKEYEKLLKMPHDAINRNSKRNKITQKLFHILDLSATKIEVNKTLLTIIQT